MGTAAIETLLEFESGQGAGSERRRRDGKDEAKDFRPGDFGNGTAFIVAEMFQAAGENAVFATTTGRGCDIEPDQGSLLKELQDFLSAQVEVAHGGIEIAERARGAREPSADRAQSEF